MRHLAWYASLALAALLTPVAGGAQAQTDQAPRATVRELATVEGYVDGFVRLPEGRTVIYSVNDSTFAHDVATTRRTFMGTDMVPASVSSQGDRLAFARRAEDGIGLRLWTLPIDPRTGTATGQAQLVSQRPLTRGSRARFSPDGRMLAFSSVHAPAARTADVVVVPSTGGRERVVVEDYDDGVGFAWTPDGNALDIETFNYSSPTAIERVTVADGAKRALFPRSDVTGLMTVGVSPDAQVTIHTDNPDVFVYRTSAGVEGEIDVPLPALDDAWGYDFSLDFEGRYLTATYLLPNRGMRVLDVETGRTTAVLPGETSTLQAWSPDGRRLAVLTGHLSHYDIAVVNADGSGVRRYPQSMSLGSWAGGWHKTWDRPWSPDGRFLAFIAHDGPRVGDAGGQQQQLAVLDLTSGETRVVAPIRGAILAFEWRTDGGAIRVLKRGRGLLSIVEIDLEGAERLLRDVSAEFPGARGAVITSDQDAVVAVSNNGRIEWFLVPLGAGAARQLPDPGSEPGLRPVILPGPLAVNRFAYSLYDGRGQFSAIKFVSTVGDSTRTLRLPLGVTNLALMGPDNIVVVSGNAGDSSQSLFLVPIEGGAPRPLGEIGGRLDGGRLASSPDGKLVAFGIEGGYTSQLHEIDFAPALRAILRR